MFNLKKVLMTVCLLLITSYSFAEITFLTSDKGNVNFYGFIKLDGFSDDGGVNLRDAPMYAVPGDNTDFHLSAKTTRFGFKWTGNKFDNGWTLGAKMEFDLFDTSTNNKYKVRERVIVFTLTKNNSSWMFGQHWDIFAPVNATTLNTIGNLYKTGNLGFRRPQIRYSYKINNFGITASINDPTSDGGIESGSPLYELNLKYSIKGNLKGTIGVSGAFGQERYTEGSLQQDVDISGLNGYFNLKVNNVNFKGEYTTGENLALFVSRGNVFFDATTNTFDGVDTDSFWIEVVITSNTFNFWGGISNEKLTNTKQLTETSYEKTSNVFAGIGYKFTKTITFGLEFSQYTTDIYSGDNIDTNQIQFSAIYKF